jgi:electron transport complex protein RnfB
MNETPYQNLAKRLDALPNGFPSTVDGAELRILEYLYTSEEAELTSKLRLTLETPQEIADRLGRDPQEMRMTLKDLTKRGLIKAGKSESGSLGYGLLPFVVGIYEYQINNITAEFAQLFEDYHQQSFTEILKIAPTYHRVVPVNETVRNDMAVEPFESAVTIIENAKSWGVLDCICRVQKKLIGDPCEHPIDVCMVFNERPGVFDSSDVVKALTKEEAYATLKRAADAGLVHAVSNSQDGHEYICNCCTCSCGVLRGIASVGIANSIARSSFVNTVDVDLCAGCETCIEYCQFNALSLRPEDPYIQINQLYCVGCGVCVPHCPDEALSLIRRPDEELLITPKTHEDWLKERAIARGLDINQVL